MRATLSVLMIAFVLLTFVGVAVATNMFGEVVAVDAAQGTLTLKSGGVNVGFDCEKGALSEDVKVGNQVTVEYKEVGGKKTATKVTVKKMKVVAPGY
jgi:hypothetical protein